MRGPLKLNIRWDPPLKRREAIQATFRVVLNSFIKEIAGKLKYHHPTLTQQRLSAKLLDKSPATSKFNLSFTCFVKYSTLQHMGSRIQRKINKSVIQVVKNNLQRKVCEAFGRSGTNYIILYTEDIFWNLNNGGHLSSIIIGLFGCWWITRS